MSHLIFELLKGMKKMSPHGIVSKPIIIPVISNIANFYQSLQEALSYEILNSMKIPIQFLSWPSNECPSKLLLSSESSTPNYPIIISDCILDDRRIFQDSL